MPQRIQRKRTPGWKMPPNTIYVGRRGRWGNPFKVGDDMPGLEDVRMDAEDTVHMFQIFCVGTVEGDAIIRKELRGKNLACWCALNQPCHADVLLKIANE